MKRACDTSLPCALLALSDDALCCVARACAAAEHAALFVLRRACVRLRALVDADDAAWHTLLCAHAPGLPRERASRALAAAHCAELCISTCLTRFMRERAFFPSAEAYFGRCMTARFGPTDATVLGIGPCHCPARCESGLACRRISDLGWQVMCERHVTSCAEHANFALLRLRNRATRKRRPFAAPLTSNANPAFAARMAARARDTVVQASALFVHYCEARACLDALLR